jgi:hypothetical protein
MLNEVIFLQALLLIIVLFYGLSINIFSSWLLAGLYLLFLGNYLLLDDCDIFVGFLWVLDLGVGLVFLVFIFYFSDFLFFKVLFNVFSRFFISFFFISFFFISFFFFLNQPVESNFYLNSLWFFFISYYDYYLFFNFYGLIDLNLVRELYYNVDSFEFFLINFFVLYNIFNSIVTLFLNKRISVLINTPYFLNLNFLSKVESFFFLRYQNVFKQKNTSPGSQVWFKNKSYNVK